MTIIAEKPETATYEQSLRNIKAAFSMSGMRIADLSAASGLDARTVLNILDGKHSMTVGEIASIVRALDMPWSEVFAGARDLLPGSSVELSKDLITVTPSSDTKHAEWAAAHLADLPVRLIFMDPAKAKVSLLATEGGQVFRDAFEIVADPAGKKEFRLYLKSGASTTDLEMAQLVIRKAKSGNFNADLWKHFEDRGTWIHDLAWKVGPNDRHVEQVRECTEAACKDTYHAFYEGSGVNGAHTLEHIEHPKGHYVVHGENVGDGKGWYAWADANDIPDGRAGLKALRDLLNDFEWMQAECEKLNAAEGVAA